MPTNAPIDPDRELDDLANDLYDTLRQLAQHALRRTPSGVLDPTELVHQAWLRLNEGFSGMPRVEFLALCSTVMRRMAVDEARRQAVRDGGSGHERVTLTSIPSDPQRRPFDLLQLDRALVRLRRADERWARIVEMRFFGGMTGDEVAEALEMSRRTVGRDWALARAWLKKELS
ncbi:MAG: ECF-type sigma factor [Planctomycetota bacterium]